METSKNRNESDQVSKENIESAFEKFLEVRNFTETLCEGLETEDYVVQSAPEVSPVKWHLAHTSWFFETFILKPFKIRFHPFDDRFEYLFNSYYETVGSYFPKELRGTLSRPTVSEIYSYRKFINKEMSELMHQPNLPRDVLQRMIIGINHEQQHEELMLMDIKLNFFNNPLKPAYREYKSSQSNTPGPLQWIGFEGGLASIGHNSEKFAFDNESPRHQVYVKPFRIASRLVTNQEYLEFMDDGGYSRPELWLSDGWRKINSSGWRSPLYWEKKKDGWYEFSLSGLRRLVPEDPVSHVSFYEALAFANWAGKRLPTEQEWEIAMDGMEVGTGDNFLESGYLRPVAPAERKGSIRQGLGDLWEWTHSPYMPYPGTKALPGALGEYNVKFMANQMVLRGGSCVTPASHIRTTYRNFFHMDERWPFTGIRLAEDA